MSDTPDFMTHERIMTGEEYVSYSDYLLLKKERDELRQEWGKASMDAAQLFSEKTKVIAERDELREEVASLRLEAKYHDEADALRKCRERERDEARYEAAMWALQRDEARELVKAYQDYTQLLGDEISNTAAVAYTHGWRSNRYEQGKVLREKIKQLEEAK